MQKSHPKSKAKPPDHLHKQTTLLSHTGLTAGTWAAQAMAEELRAALNRHTPRRLFQGAAAPQAQAGTHRQSFQHSLPRAQLGVCGSFTRGEAWSDRAAPQQLHSPFLPHSQGHTTSAASPQALPHTKVGTLTSWDSFSGRTIFHRTTEEHPPHHVQVHCSLSPHPTSFTFLFKNCLGWGWSRNIPHSNWGQCPSIIWSPQDTAPRAEYKARTHWKCG